MIPSFPDSSTVACVKPGVKLESVWNVNPDIFGKRASLQLMVWVGSYGM